MPHTLHKRDEAVRQVRSELVSPMDFELLLAQRSLNDPSEQMSLLSMH
jgi:hypothetical protein